MGNEKAKMKAFSYTVNQNENYAVFNLKGRIMTDETINDLLEKVTITLDKTSNIILNLSELSYLNSSGLNCFISILTKSRVNGGETIITYIPEVINKLLIISKLNTVFETRPTLAEAISEFEQVKS